MPFIPVNLDDITESKPVTPGLHQATITSCELTKTGDESKKPGTPMLKISIGFQEEPDTMNLTHYLVLMNEDDDAEQIKQKARGLKRFLELFHVSYAGGSGIDVEEIRFKMIGCSAKVETELSDTDKQGRVFSRLKVPYLK